VVPGQDVVSSDERLANRRVERRRPAVDVAGRVEVAMPRHLDRRLHYKVVTLAGEVDRVCPLGDDRVAPHRHEHEIGLHLMVGPTVSVADLESRSRRGDARHGST
jgi:hypothetical protein